MILHSYGTVVQAVAMVVAVAGVVVVAVVLRVVAGMLMLMLAAVQIQTVLPTEFLWNTSMRS